MGEKSVLVCLEGSSSKRPTKISSGGSLGALEAATWAVYPEMKLEDHVLLFQIWSDEWATWIDLMEGENIPDKSKIQVVVKAQVKWH